MFRKVIVGVSRHGRKLFEGVFNKGEAASKNGKIKDDIAKVQPLPCQRSAPQRFFASLKDAPTKGFVSKYLARYAQKNLATELRRQFSISPIYREYRGLASKLSMYAFVGVGLASWNKDEQDFSNVCEHIRNIFDAKSPDTRDDPLEDLHGHGLKDYHLGSMIAKGCNAAVYQAKYTGQDVNEDVAVSDDSDAESGVMSDETSEYSDLDSDIEVIEDEFPPTSFMVQDTPTETMSYVFVDDEDDGSDVEIVDDDHISDPGDVIFLMSCEREVDENASEPLDTGQPSMKPETNHHTDCDLAIKMVFNYAIESNAGMLYKELEKEMLPARSVDGLDELLDDWHNGHRAKEKNRLPPHPNIVAMYGGFVDDVPWLPEALEQYPDALPQRLNPEGSGRNKTLFLVMKKYPYTLREYLESHPTLSVHHRTLLLIQLVEAVRHMTQHQVAHRDLKSDNIFVEELDGCPHLVVSDFGDCVHQLNLPYITDEISKGGNIALQAPEIATACSGPTSELDYSKSDLWTVGTLGYEIFGQHNPFYRNNGVRLSSATYREDELPSLSDDVPYGLESLMKQMLRRDPQQRPRVSEVSTCLHLMLWSPCQWSLTLASRSNQRARSEPTNIEIMRWMLTSTAQVLLEKLSPGYGVQHDLRASFMAHVNFEEVEECIERMYCW